MAMLTSPYCIVAQTKYFKGISMAFLDKLKNRVQEVAAEVADKVKDNLVEPEVAKKRIEICIACPKLIQITKTCKECGCFMGAKTKLKNVECPLNKW